jgi:AcrR family transcriptional regulator
MSRARPYHHGNLKQALLEAALELIAETGPRGFTLREAARRAGVSHNAPYRHFKDKDELLGAVAAQGFERLTQALKAAPGDGGPLERLRQAGLLYVEFALRWPQHFAAMFDSPWREQAYPVTAAAAEGCFQALLEMVRDCQASHELPAGDAEQLAYWAWSLVHGIAKLANSGQFPWRSRAQVLAFCAFALNRGVAQMKG